MKQRVELILEDSDKFINRLARYLLVGVFIFCLLCLFKIQVVEGAAWGTPAFVLGGMGVVITFFLLFKLSTA